MTILLNDSVFCQQGNNTHLLPKDSGDASFRRYVSTGNAPCRMSAASQEPDVGASDKAGTGFI